MTSAAGPRRRRPRTTAARQALALCEAELLPLTRDSVPVPHSGRGQLRIRVITTRAALRAAGVPPDIAAVLRRRLRLIPEQEPDR